MDGKNGLGLQNETEQEQYMLVRKSSLQQGFTDPDTVAMAECRLHVEALANNPSVERSDDIMGLSSGSHTRRDGEAALGSFRVLWEFMT